MKIVDDECEPLSSEAAVTRIVEQIGQMDPVTRSLLIRNFGIGEKDDDTLDRFEAFHSRLRHNPFSPSLQYSQTLSTSLRQEDAARNFRVVVDHDVEGRLLEKLETDQASFLFQQFLNSIDFDIRGRVIELGAGSCWLSAEFSKMPEVEEVVAVDLSDNELLLKAPIALETFQANMEKMTFIVGNFNAAHFQPESFDVVAFARALHHSSDVRESLRQAHRLLRTGGRVIAFQEHIQPRVLSPQRRRALARRTTVELSLAQYRQAFAETGFRMKTVPYFCNNPRKIWRLTVNDRHLVQYTPRRFLNGLFYAHFHLVATKV